MILFDFQPLGNQEPEVTSQVKAVMSDAANGTMRPAHYSEAFWESFEPAQAKIRADLAKLGNLKSSHLIGEERDEKLTNYSYILVFENARVLMQFKLDEARKVHDLRSYNAYLRK